MPSIFFNHIEIKQEYSNRRKEKIYRYVQTKQQTLEQQFDQRGNHKEFLKNLKTNENKIGHTNNNEIL